MQCNWLRPIAQLHSIWSFDLSSVCTVINPHFCFNSSHIIYCCVAIAPACQVPSAVSDGPFFWITAQSFSKTIGCDSYYRPASDVSSILVCPSLVELCCFVFYGSSSTPIVIMHKIHPYSTIFAQSIWFQEINV
jgi:hypothetical protein